MKVQKEQVFKTVKDAENEKKQSAKQWFELDFFSLPDDVKKELDEKGLVGRFISLKSLEDYNGFHPKGWRVYKREVPENSDFTKLFGRDPDGYVRRRDLILAVKTKDEVEAHKAYLKHQADEVNTSKLSERRAQELQDYLIDSLGKKIGKRIAVITDY